MCKLLIILCPFSIDDNGFVSNVSQMFAFVPLMFGAGHLLLLPPTPPDLSA